MTSRRTAHDPGPALARAVGAVVLFALLCAAPALAGEEEALAGADVTVRLKLADQLEGKDALALARSLASFGDAKKGKAKPEDVEFLCEYVIREPARALRMVALESLYRIDPEGAGAFFAKRATGEDQVKTVYSLEALGYLGAEDHADAALALVADADEIIAMQALDTLARIGDRKQVDQFLLAGLEHDNARVADRAAWAAQDLFKKTKPVVGKLTKLSKKASERVQVTAESVKGALEDETTMPHAWPKKFDQHQKLVLAAPDAVPIVASSKKYEKLLQETLEYMRKEMPGQELMVRVAAKGIVMPGKVSGRYIDFEGMNIEVPATYVAQKPHQLSYHIARAAVVLYRKQVGEPYTGERGWGPALWDSYDVCVIAGLNDCGPGGLNRRGFLDTIFSKRPWDGS